MPTEDYLKGLLAGLSMAGRWSAIASPRVYEEALRLRSARSGKGGRRRLPGNFITCLAAALDCSAKEAQALACALEKAGLLERTEWGRWYVLAPQASPVRRLIESEV